MRSDVLEHVADGVVVADADGLVRYINPAAERLTGRSSARAVNRPLAEVFEKEPALVLLASRALDANSPIASDGLSVGGVPIDVIAAPLSSPPGVVLTLRDRSVARRLAAEAQISERLASLATVAAGIAHEVKNPLGGIRGAAQLLARGASIDGDAHEYLDVIVREVDRIAALVDRLRDLAAPEVSGTHGPVDVNRLLHELVLLQGATRESAIELDLDPSLPAVAGDAGSLTRLFLNLVRNALEAPSKNVRVTTRIETGRRRREADGLLHGLICVSVEDDGPGIAAPHRERLFEPFFTTKASGTGLGLATAQRITHDHGGTIAYEEIAAGGTGARFVVTLPTAGAVSKEVS